jgi:hypothetical protein
VALVPLQLAVVYFAKESETERNLFELARCLGIEAEFVCVGPSGLTYDLLLHEFQRAKAIAISASSLCQIETLGVIAQNLFRLNQDPQKHILVYGFIPHGAHDSLVSRLTGAVIRTITTIPNATRTSFLREAGPLLGPLVGCHFERDPGPSGEPGFELEAEPGAMRIMQVGRSPVFMRFQCGGNAVFLWANGAPVPNPRAPFAEADLVRHCDRFVPALVFFRSAFSGYCWENPIKTARIIIDDPLLKERYGFIHYEEMLRITRRLGCGVTTAFIPWNWRRTSRRAARLFAQFLPDHSICVHGCDHTGNEFGGGNEHDLTAKALVALERMDNHGGRTDLGSSRVMVFPQGKFSSAAMRALRRAGFLAAVNTTRVPTDHPNATVPLVQELQPAVTSYSGLPLFKRRYPADLEGCALDLFLGRPAHIVEHHNWFRQGCGDFERCVQWLKSVQPGLSWPSLEVGLPQQQWRRTSTNGEMDIRFFTSQFSFENPLNDVASFAFSKPEPEANLVKSVTIDGQPVAYDLDEGMVRFCLELRPKQITAIEVKVDHGDNAVRWSPPFKYRVQVGLRRALSEVRDNHLAKHPTAYRAARTIIGAFHARSR